MISVVNMVVVLIQMMDNFVVNVVFFSVEIVADQVRKFYLNKFLFNFILIVSREGSQVILAAILVVSACLTPILFRSIYRILKRKLDRSSTIYGKLHCMNNRLGNKNYLNIYDFIWIVK